MNTKNVFSLGNDYLQATWAQAKKHMGNKQSLSLAEVKNIFKNELGDNFNADAFNKIATSFDKSQKTGRLGRRGTPPEKFNQKELCLMMAMLDGQSQVDGRPSFDNNLDGKNSLFATYNKNDKTMNTDFAIIRNEIAEYAKQFEPKPRERSGGGPGGSGSPRPMGPI